MRPHGTHRANGRLGTWSALLAACLAASSLGLSLQAGEVPPQMPLWENGSPGHAIRHETQEQVRSHKAEPGSPSGLNRELSFVSSMPTCWYPQRARVLKLERIIEQSRTAMGWRLSGRFWTRGV